MRRIIAALFLILAVTRVSAADLSPSYSVPGYLTGAQPPRLSGTVILCPSSDGSYSATACNFAGGGSGSSTPTTPNGTATTSSVPVADGATGGSVALASKQEPFAVTTTQTGGTTSGTAGTFTTATTANASRHGCTLQNTSTGTLYVFFGSGTASTTNAFQVLPSDTITCEMPGLVLTDAIQVGASIASATYVEAVQ